MKLSYDLHQMQAISLPLEQPAAGPQALAATPATGPEATVNLQAKAGEAAALLKALANPGRLLLLCQLVAGERSVNELGSLAGMAQPSLSQQLAVLRGERLVATRREGKQVVYRIASPAALKLLQTLYGLFCEPTPGPLPLTTRRAAKPSRMDIE